MGNIKWSSVEVETLTKLYAIKKTYELVSYIPEKSIEQIKSKAKTLKLKKIKNKEECIHCKKIIPVGKTAICAECKNIKSVINIYKNKYGIILDFGKYFNTYAIIQWYKWTTTQKTPNGKTLAMLPKELQTKENIGILGRYVINNLLGYYDKESILSLSQKDICEHRVSFSKNPLILNSPINLIRLSFPELEFYNWEMKHAGNNYWKDYKNFIEATLYYYKEIYKKRYFDTSIEVAFSEAFITEKFIKLRRAHEVHYNHKTWQEILMDAGITEEFPTNNKIALDGEKMDSFEERIVYEHIKYKLGLDNIKKSITNNKDYAFYDEKFNRNYYPDFILELDNKKVVIEYFGAHDNVKNVSMYKGYKEKMENKISYFNSLEDVAFIPLYNTDIRRNCEGINNKLKDYL